jgi:hypothetical protein
MAATNSTTQNQGPDQSESASSPIWSDGVVTGQTSVHTPNVCVTYSGNVVAWAGNPDGWVNIMFYHYFPNAGGYQNFSNAINTFPPVTTVSAISCIGSPAVASYFGGNELCIAYLATDNVLNILTTNVGQSESPAAPLSFATARFPNCRSFAGPAVASFNGCGSRREAGYAAASIFG